MTQPTFEQLLVEYGNAMFLCGESDDNLPSEIDPAIHYGKLHDRAQTAKDKVIQMYKEKK